MALPENLLSELSAAPSIHSIYERIKARNEKKAELMFPRSAALNCTEPEN